MKPIRYMLLAAAIMAAACTKDINERKIHEGTGLGFPQKVIDIEAPAGEVHVDVIATKDYEIDAKDGWIDTPSSAPSGKDGFNLKYGANEGLPRAGTVVISIEDANHRDTLTLRQKGTKEPRLAAASPVISLKGSVPGHESIELDTNIPDNAFEISYTCEGGERWLSGVAVQGGALVFDYTANPDNITRRGSAIINYTDAFGNLYQIVFQISQMTSEDSFGAEKTISELKALATEEGLEIEEETVIEGIVVSDKANGNCGDNPQTGATSIDYSYSERTIYLEALDGSTGIMMLTKTPDDNVFLQGDKVKFSLRGATLFKSASIGGSPVYYWLTGVKGSMSISSAHLGRGGIPVKEKYMGSLTDDDIFTYVTLKDCEFPVPKGTLTPVSEKFTSAGGSDKVSKFAVLLHDICGNSMYLYTNTTCPYRRDGTPLPAGSVSMSGVVVHELFPRFSYMDSSSSDPDTWGNIGRYQLRHTCREDFGVAESAEDGFSAVICEWRYILDKNLEIYYATGGDKNAYFTYSFIYPNSYTDGRAGKLPIIKYQDFSDPGPIGDDLGVTKSDVGSAWATNLTARDGKPMYTTLVFSTAGISASKMSIQISSLNYFYSSTQKINGVDTYLEGPRYWYVEWSLDNKNWTRAGGYVLPDLCQVTPMTQPWQTPGYKPVSVELPAKTLLGKEKVYIRIIPEAELRTGSQSQYLDPSIVYPNSGSFPTAWNYIGIRYNTKDAPATDFGGGDIDPVNPIDFNW